MNEPSRWDAARSRGVSDFVLSSTRNPDRKPSAHERSRRAPGRFLAWAWHPSHGDKSDFNEDRTDHVEVVTPGAMTVDDHCTYLASKRLVLNITYPDKPRNQHPTRDIAERADRCP